MECKRFALLLEDVESSRYNVGRIEILKCYVCQKFTAEQITKLLKPMTRSNAKLKGFRILVEEMNDCRLEEVVALINEISVNTIDEGNRFSCLQELVKYKKLNLKEGEKVSLFALFEGTVSEEIAAKLLNITLQYQCTKMPLSSKTATITSPLSQPPSPLPSTNYSSVRTTSFIPPNMTNCVCENAINPTTIGFVLPQETPHPSPLPHSAIAPGPPQVGFNIQL